MTLKDEASHIEEIIPPQTEEKVFMEESKIEDAIQHISEDPVIV
jgi:hypothetical protein